MSNRRRTGRSCAAFGEATAASARDPAPFRNLGFLVSLIARETQGINDEFAQVKEIVCAEEV